MISVHRWSRAISPRRTEWERKAKIEKRSKEGKSFWERILLFISTVSAMSSALCPVTSLSAHTRTAPRSRACRLNTPQKVQLLRRPATLTTRSIVHPYSSYYNKMVKAITYRVIYISKNLKAAHLVRYNPEWKARERSKSGEGGERVITVPRNAFING